MFISSQSFFFDIPLLYSRYFPFLFLTHFPILLLINMKQLRVAIELFFMCIPCFSYCQFLFLYLQGIGDIFDLLSTIRMKEIFIVFLCVYTSRRFVRLSSYENNNYFYRELTLESISFDFFGYFRWIGIDSMHRQVLPYYVHYLFASILYFW